MQRLMLTAACAMLALAFTSCGAGQPASIGSAAGRVRLSAELTPEYNINASSAAVSLVDDGAGVVLSLSGLNDTKALYGRLFYDPARQSFTGSSQLASELLFVAFDQPARGYVEFGMVVPNWDVKPGISGSLELARLSFNDSPVPPARAASKAPGSVPEDAITLTGSLDTNNIPTLTWRESLTGDCDNNGEVNISDFSAFGIHYRKTAVPGNPDESEVRDCDFNRDGEVAITDIQKMGQSLGATLGGYFIRAGSTATGLSDLEQIERTDFYPTARRQDGEIMWEWTGVAITSDTFYQVEPYDRGNFNRGTPSDNQLLLQPVIVDPNPVFTSVTLTFQGRDTWPASMIDAGSGDYLILVTENSVDGIAGNGEQFSGEHFAPEVLQLQVLGDPDNDPGNLVDITSTAYIGLSEGAGLASVSLASATRGQLTFKDRGRIVVRTFAPGNFTVTDEIGFRLYTIDSMSMTSGNGNSPVNVGSGSNVQFTVSGVFDWDSDGNGNEISVNITSFCSWGLLPAAGNGGSFVLRTDTGALQTGTAQSGDNATIFAEFPNTDNVKLFDNQKRSTAPFVVNIN